LPVAAQEPAYTVWCYWNAGWLSRSSPQ